MPNTDAVTSGSRPKLFVNNGARRAKMSYESPYESKLLYTPSASSENYVFTEDMLREA